MKNYINNIPVCTKNGKNDNFAVFGVYIDYILYCLKRVQKPHFNQVELLLCMIMYVCVCVSVCVCVCGISYPTKNMSKTWVTKINYTSLKW